MGGNNVNPIPSAPGGRTATTPNSEAARSLLRLHFDQPDLDRIHALAVKAQDGALSEDEQAELENYRRVGRLLDLMHPKTRLTLQIRSRVLN